VQLNIEDAGRVTDAFPATAIWRVIMASSSIISSIAGHARRQEADLHDADGARCLVPNHGTIEPGREKLGMRLTIF